MALHRISSAATPSILVASSGPSSALTVVSLAAPWSSSRIAARPAHALTAVFWGAQRPRWTRSVALLPRRLKKAIADIDRALAVPPLEFLRLDEMRRDFALALATYEATNAFRKTVGKLARSRPCLRERKAVLDCALKTLWWMCRAVEEFCRNELGECNQFGEPIACRPSQGDRTWMTPESFLKEAAAAEEPEVFGHMRAEMTSHTSKPSCRGDPPWGCRESPERGGISQGERTRRLVD